MSITFPASGNAKQSSCRKRFDFISFYSCRLFSVAYVAAVADIRNDLPRRPQRLDERYCYDVMASVSDGGWCRLSVTHESRYGMYTVTAASSLKRALRCLGRSVVAVELPDSYLNTASVFQIFGRSSPSELSFVGTRELRGRNRAGVLLYCVLQLQSYRVTLFNELFCVLIIAAGHWTLRNWA